MDAPTETAVAAVAPVDDLVVTSSGDAAPTSETSETVVSAQGDGDPGEETHHADPAPDDAAASDAAKTLAKRKRTAQDRINDLARDKYRLEGENAALRAQQSSRSAAADPAQPAPPPASPSDAGLVEPKEEDFDTYAQFVRATSRYETRLALADQDRSRAVEQGQAQYREIASAHDARVAAFKAITPDYDDVIASQTAVYPTPVLAEAVLHSDLAPQIAYHLNSHVDEYRALNALPPGLLLKALGRLEARLEAAHPSASAPNPKPVPPPPAPLTPIATGGSAAPASPDDLPFGRDYIRAQNQADVARGRRY